jgi:hypothetical protein
MMEGEGGYSQFDEEFSELTISYSLDESVDSNNMRYYREGDIEEDLEFGSTDSGASSR